LSKNGRILLATSKRPCNPEFIDCKISGNLDSMPPLKSEPKRKGPRVRDDGRRTLLVYMDADLIKEVKKAALDDERNVYEIVEQATRDWLGKRTGARTRFVKTKPAERSNL
jgi:hypothetical protein